MNIILVKIAAGWIVSFLLCFTPYYAVGFALLVVMSSFVGLFVAFSTVEMIKKIRSAKL